MLILNNNSPKSLTEIIRPVNGIALAVHFYYKFPSAKHYLSRYNNFLLNRSTFLDIQSVDEIKNQIVENNTSDLENGLGEDFAKKLIARPATSELLEIYRKVDSCLRKRFKIEQQALEVLDLAVDQCLNEKLQWSSNPKDYLPLFNIEAPIFHYILRTSKFKNTREMYDFVLGG